MQEVWKDIEGYEGAYKISNHGNVYSNYTNKILKPSINSRGYMHVSLYKNKRTKMALIHRLVAVAFIPNPNQYPFVNHKDENPSNNNVNNLEWCTPSYNINYGARNIKVSQGGIPVMQVTLDDVVVATYINAKFAADILNYDHSTLYKCLRGESPQAYGYKWFYCEIPQK